MFSLAFSSPAPIQTLHWNFPKMLVVSTSCHGLEHHGPKTFSNFGEHSLLYWRCISQAGPIRTLLTIPTLHQPCWPRTLFWYFMTVLVVCTSCHGYERHGPKKFRILVNTDCYTGATSARLAQGWRAGEWSWFWSFRIPIIPYFEHWS